MKNIPTIVLDVGDVLFLTNPDEQYRRLCKISGKKIEEVRKIVESNNLLSDYERGKFKTDAFINKVNDLLGINTSRAEFEEIWNSVLDRPNIEIINKLISLRERYNLILASNTNELHWGYISSIFDSINFKLPAFLSFERGYKKPDENYFTELIKTFSLEPKLTIFIDDNNKSTAMASSLGIRSHQHTNNTDTLKFLSSL